ncbi:hypothetical protein SAMN04487897_10610 [Paenibacillus sp. yr247]|nr:hypothetical protein SAMN04487897_10610 [Paenibacillus sp. yr247]
MNYLVWISLLATFIFMMIHLRIKVNSGSRSDRRIVWPQFGIIISFVTSLIFLGLYFEMLSS